MARQLATRRGIVNETGARQVATRGGIFAETVSAGGGSVDGTGASTVGDFVSSGSGASGSGSTGTGDSTVGDFVSTASGSASAAITTAPFKNNTGTVLASTTIDLVAALSLTDLSVVASWTAQTTDASGILTLTDAALVSGTSYLVVTCDTDGTPAGTDAGARAYQAS